jgi:hypothetical protein
MAVVYPTTAGTWSTRTWNNDADGSAYGMAPQPGDTVYANGLAISIDITIPVGISLSTRPGITAIAGGAFATSGWGVIVQADTYAGTTSCLTLTSGSGSVQIGNSYGSDSTGSRYGTVLSQGCIHIGNSYGGNGAARIGSMCQTGSRHIGHSYGGSASGAYGTQCLNGGFQVGNSHGGSASGAYGTYCTNSGFHIGGCIGGSVSGAYGSYITGTCRLLIGSIIHNVSGGAFATSGVEIGLFNGIDISAVEGTSLVELAYDDPFMLAYAHWIRYKRFRSL